MPDASKRTSSDRPAVVVIPGFMGTHLAAGGKRIWLSMRMLGGFDRLAYREQPSDGVRPDGLIGLNFDELLDRLAGSFEVVPFPYDWRAPMEYAARHLANLLHETLDRRTAASGPLHLLTHGSGALIARTLQLEAPAVWERLMANEDARLLMLGPPHRGSWAPMQLLSGDDTFGNTLAALGSPSRESRTRRHFAAFPGLLQMQAGLTDPAVRLSEAATWQWLADADRQAVASANWWHSAKSSSQDWAVPTQAILDQAVALRRRLDAQQTGTIPRHASQLLQILGRSKFTPDGYELGESGFVYVNAVDGGDGRTTKGSAWIPGVAAWQADVEHGALLSDKAVLEAMVDLLNDGTTARLPAASAAQTVERVAQCIQTTDAAHRLDEARLVLVGRGGAGKTSIVDRLLNDHFLPDRPATEGIDISTWPLQIADRSMRVNVWDFAGQADTHSTHQLFMSAGSVHILVVAASAETQRRGEDVPRRDAEYWLRLIQARTADEFGAVAPVIVVCNQADTHPLVLDRDALCERYPFVVGFVDTDCRSGRGIRELRRVLDRTLDALPLGRRGVPATWHMVRNQLAHRQSTAGHMRYVDFQAICFRCGETEPERQSAFADNFDMLGIALLFGRDDGLPEPLLFDPRWITGCIYRLLRAGPETQGDATLSRTRAARLLPDEPRHLLDFLLEAMRRFELTFPLDDSGERFMLPQWLPAQPVDLGRTWKPDADVTQLRYRYPIALEGLIPRFIARTHLLSDGLPRWAQGVVLELGTARALVRLDELERCVDVSVVGDALDRLDLLGVIRGDFKAIHATIPGLRVVEELLVLVQSYQSVAVLEADEAEGHPTGVATSRGTRLLDATQALNRLSAPQARQAVRRARLFISYSSKDVRMLQALSDRLKALAHTHGLIEEVWTDHCIAPGADWNLEVRAAIARADVAVLLVSSNFRASDYIRAVEVNEVLSRSQRGECVVVPVILEAMDGWEQEPFGSRNALPRKGIPVRSFRPYSKGWALVAQGPRELLSDIALEPDTPQPLTAPG